ncbi:MAG: tryptophan tryptophylquinone biosynthesis enzyme MauG [Candidatus Cloacimonetes bacterium]|nr:tryptophan tryptophylquinone biosynthesis enzyme MauG [Candidatus Cloacimonadota bacterium]
MLKFLSLILFLSIGSIVYSEPLSTPDVEDIEYPDDEEPSSELITLGKTLFFDHRLSKNKNQSCATCHNPNLGFGEGVAHGFGTMGGKLERNTPHIYNLAWATTFFWDGRSSTLEEQAVGPIEANGEMAMPMPKFLERLRNIKGYKSLIKKAFGDEKIDKERVTSAIAAFERTIIVDNTPFDRYMAGDLSAMTPKAIEGMNLFKGKALCIQCHDGANFTDDSFHNLGIDDKDLGRGKIVKDKTLNGAFKTPGLRNVLMTAPYMHNGQEGTLEDVIKFYNKGGGSGPNKDKLMVPLNLTDQEIFSLVAFLGSLNQKLEIFPPKLPKE